MSVHFDRGTKQNVDWPDNLQPIAGGNARAGGVRARGLGLVDLIRPNARWLGNDKTAEL